MSYLRRMQIPMRLPRNQTISLASVVAVEFEIEKRSASMDEWECTVDA